MKKIILLLTFLFVAKINFAQYNWQPVAQYGFNTNGTNIMFLKQYGAKLYSGIYDNSLLRPVVYAASSDTVNAFVPMYSLNMSGDSIITSVATTPNAGGYIFVGAIGNSGGDVYGSNNEGTSWNQIFSNSNGTFNSSLVTKNLAVVNSLGVDYIVQNLQFAPSVSISGVHTDFYLNDNLPITTCDGNLFDSGGPAGTYNNFEDFTKTIYPGTPGQAIQLNFAYLSVENNYEQLYIYDGIDASAPLIGQYTASNSPGIITASNPSGALTVRFHSDGSVAYSGWEATIKCASAGASIFLKAPLNATSNASWTTLDTIANQIIDVATFNNKFYALAKDGKLYQRADLNSAWINLGVVTQSANYFNHLETYNNHLYISGHSNGNGAVLFRGDTSLNFVTITYNSFGNYTNAIDFVSLTGTSSAIYTVCNGSPTKVWKSIDGFNFYAINANGIGGENDGTGSFAETFLGKEFVSGYSVSGINGAQIWNSCVPPSAQIIFNGSTNICLNDVKTFKGTPGAVNYKWYVNDSLYQNSSDSIFAPANIFNVAGTYLNVRLAVMGTQCGDSSAVSFYVNNLPTNPPLAFYDTTICSQSGVLIKQSFVGGLRTNGGSYYHLLDSNLVDLGYLGAGNVYPSDTSIYYVITIDYNGCRSSYDTVVVNTFALPNVQILSAGPDFCVGDSLRLIASGANSYSWSCGLYTDTIYEYATIQEILMGTDSNNCANYDTINAVLHNNPIVNIGADPVICQGQSVNLNAASIGGVSGIWAPSIGLSSATSSATTASPDTSTTYVYTSYSLYACASTDTLTVLVNPYPSPLIIGVDTVCNGASGVGYSTALVGGNSYAWTVNGGTIVSGQGTESIVVNWINPSVANISCVETNIATGCSGNNSKTITVNAVLPTITANNNVCAGALNETASVVSVAGDTYSWTVNGGTITSGQNSNAISIDWGTGSFGVISITQTNAQGCTGTSTFNVSLNAPVISISPTSTVCSGATNITYAVANNAGSTYAWSVSGGNIVSGQSTNSLTVNWAYGAIGNISVSETNALGCAATNSVNISLTTPTVSITPTTATCAGATNVVYAVANNAGSTYNWTINNGTIVSGQTTDSITVNWGTGAFGNITATETNATGCTATSSVNITLNAPTVAITPTTAVCSGATNVVYSVANNAGSSYNWSISGGTIVSGQTTNSVTVNWANGTFGNLSATETTASGCVGMASVNISLTAPSPTIAPTTSACAGSAGLVYSVPSNAGSSYNWTIAGGTITAGQSTNSITVSWNNGVLGNLAVAETSVSGCTGTSSANISLTSPIVSAGNDVSICNGANTTLNGSASGAGPFTYVWTPSTTLSSATITNPVATPSVNTNYVLTATDANGCSASDQVTVSLNSIYSTFTGNVQYDSLGTIKVVRAGTVKAFSADSAGLIYPVSVAYISSNGTFALYGIPGGNYKIFIEPNSNIYPYLSNIYYNGANLWEDANPIAFSCGNAINQVINLPDYVTPVTGTASISGRILADANYQGKTNVQGDPIPGVDVSLEQNPGSVMLATTSTNANGDFAFYNLSPNIAGTWYTLLVNIPGYGLDSTYEHIVIGANQASVHNDYLVGDSVIYIDSVLSATLNGVKSIVKSDLVKSFESYPNPYSLETTINYSIIENANVKLEVYNALGQRVESIVNTNQAAGIYKYNFAAKNSGVYYVRLVVNDKVSVLKLVEM